MPNIRLIVTCLLLLNGLNPWSYNSAVAQTDTITLSFTCMDGEPGDIVCLSAEIENFTDVEAVQLSFNFDPSVLNFVNVQNEGLTGAFVFNPGPTEVRYVWTDPLAGSVDLVDGTVLLELCFEIVGIPGSSTSFGLMLNSLQEIGTITGVAPLVSDMCNVTVLEPNTVGALITSCGSPDGIGPGEFTITAYGGAPPYTYTWTGPVNGSSNLVNSGDSEIQTLPIGMYDIVVTDANGAMFMTTASILNLTFSNTVQILAPVTCYNFTNGVIQVEATDGAAPYGVIWENTTNPAYQGSTFIPNAGGFKNLTSLPVGNYSITITDDNGCSAIETVTLSADEYIIDNIVITDAMCIGSLDGGVSFAISGASPIPPGMVYDMQFSWMGGTQTASSFNISTLDPGTYSITISDNVAQCDTVFEFTIGSQTVITADIDLTNPTCPGAQDGAALVTGVPAGTYDFQRLDSLGNLDGMAQTGVTSANFTGLFAGLYGVLVNDGTCGSDTIWFTLTDPAPMTIAVLNIEPQGCQFMDGSITVQAMGGAITPPSDYVYSWNGGTMMGSTISNLSAGNYVLTVMDDNMCSVDTTITVSAAQAPRIDSIVATNLSCTSDPITTLEVFFTDGSFPVTTIIWSNGETTAVINNQTGGDTLTVTIRDDKFCFDISSNFIIPGGSDFVIDSVRLESPTCPGDDDGQFTVFTSGGVEPLTYIWSTGDTTTFNLLPGLTAGDYSVTVVDNTDSCGVVTIDVILQDIESLDFFFTNIDSTGCSLVCSGQATLIPSGGDIGLPYNFFWENGLMETGAQSTATGLCGGWQEVSISQDNFCFYTDSVFIPFPDGISIDTVAFDGIVCSGSNDGFISLSASGGGGGYQYMWAVLPPGPVQANLGQGTYYVTVTDIDMCAATDSFTIVQGDSVSIILDTVTSKLIGCTGGDDGAIGLQTIGGTPSYVYTWLPNVSSGPLAQMLGPGTYEITVTDQTGCTDSISVTLVEPEPITTYVTEVIPPTCTGDLTSISIDSATGGIGTLTWSINGGQRFPMDTIIPVSVGFYNVIVFDESNCKDTTMVAIEGPPPIDLQIFPPDPIIELGDSIQLDLVISDTQGSVDSIAWGNDDGAGDLTCNDCLMPYARNLRPATYYVQVWDSAGCVSIESIYVDVDNKRNVYIPNVFSPNQDGRNEKFMLYAGQGVIGVRSVRVFNRWGDVMAEVINPPFGGTDGTLIWNGEFRGRDMEPGVYVYMAEVLFADAPDQPLIYRGDVTLIR